MRSSADLAVPAEDERVRVQDERVPVHAEGSRRPTYRFVLRTNADALRTDALLFTTNAFGG